MIGDNDPKIKPRSDWDLNIFIDSHYRQLKWLSYGLMTTGAFIVFWKIKAAKRFTKISEIPIDFIRKNYSLQGHVRQVSKTGLLHVEHIPILEIRAGPWRTHAGKDEELLPITLAGVHLNEDAIKWLEETVTEKHVWFKLLELSDASVECDVRVKKNVLKRISLSKELIKKGLCTVKHFNTPPPSETHELLVMQLLAIENTASKKGRGLWKEENMSESWFYRSKVSLGQMMGKVKKFLRIGKKE